MSAPILKGLRVVQCDRGRVSALVGMLLADQGADVVVFAADDAPPSVPAAITGRGKRRVVAPSVHDQARLLARADVVITHQPTPPVTRDDAIRLCLPATHPDQPPPDDPEDDALIGAPSGLYEVPLGRRPVYSSIPFPSQIAALYGANAVLAALIARERDGMGQTLLVPRHDALYPLLELTALLTVHPPRAWRSLQWAGGPFIGPWSCADGRTLFVHVGLGPHLRRLADLLAHHGFPALGQALSPRTLADPTHIPSLREAAKVRAILARVFAQRPALSWEDLLSEAGLCAVVCRTGAEWLRHPHATLSRQVLTLNDPHHGPITQVGELITLSHNPGAIAPRPARGVKPTSVLRRWPQRAPRQALDVDAPPLTGLKVLDLSQVIAGPVAARSLAELGAEVVRVENPHFVAGWVDAFHVAFNPGKRSVMLDLKTPMGREALWELIGSFKPDVVVHNFRPGADVRLGIGEDALRARLPNVIVLSLSAYGERGPWGRRPGWEQTAQAVTGVQVDYGGDGRPELYPLPFNDLATGLLGAHGALLALLGLRQGGPGQRASACLSATSTWMQSAFLWQWRDQSGPRARGTDALGDAPHHRFYRLRDGWFFLSCAPDALAALGPDPQATLKGLTQAQVRQRIPDCALAPRGSLRDLLAAPHAQNRVHHREHPGLGSVVETCPPVRFSRTRCQPLAPAPARGADTAELFAHLGFPAPRPRRRHLLREIRSVAAQVKWGAWIAWTRLTGG